MCSDNETNSRKADTRPRAPPPARTSKRLPTEEERLAELRHAQSANLVMNILEVADSLEQMAPTANNLKGTYVRRLRDDAGKGRANATELPKRTTAAGTQIVQKQENLQLRARLQQVSEEIAELKRRKPQPEHGEIGKGKQTAAPPERQPLPQEEIFSEQRLLIAGRLI